MTIHQFTHPATNTVLYKQIFDGIDLTHVYTSPREFIAATFDILQNGADFQISGRERSIVPVDNVLSLFCGCVFSSVAENPTTLWMDIDTNELYLVAYDYSESDYYGKAFSYIARVTI